MQHKAATYGSGPVLILAGAGSGKTKVLTSRIAHLIINKKVSPDRVLAVTFTNKAAKEIKERLEKLIGERTKELWAGTFHTIGLKILREECGLLGLKPNLSVYDEEEQALLLKLVMSEMSINEKDVPINLAQFEINLAKNGDISPETYAYEGKHLFSDVISRIYATYQKRLTKMNAVDFGDLICKPIHLFKSNPEVLEKYREKFEFILIDEYQDTNRSQYALTNSLASKKRNLCVVGDPDQSIYGWRGATLKNILKFKEDYPDAAIIKLEQNYRSTKNILSASNSVIKNNTERLEKTLWTQTEEGEPVVYEECINEYQEARFVSERVKKHMGADPTLKIGNFTVLYRTNTQSRPFEEIFFEEGIPYNLVGGFKFYDRREIKDALAYLKSLINPEDSVNFLRIINVPPRGIGKAALEKAHAISRRDNVSLFGAFKKGIAEKAFSNENITEFLSVFDMLRSEMDGMPLHEFTARVLDFTGYMDFWAEKKTEETDVRVKNLDGLISSIKNYEYNHQGSKMADYLNLVALMSDVDTYEGKDNRLTLMTIHSAKGLEFPVVFLAGMEEGLFPHKRSMDKEEEIEEERRLCYVGMTRARRQLYLLSAKNRSAGKETRTTTRSRFIDEIDPAFLKSKHLEGPKTAQESIDKIRQLLGS